MDAKCFKRKCTKIKNKTKACMTSLGTYREEFDRIIERYAEMRVEFEILNEQWAEAEYMITELYTNKSGATNERKTALYSAIEKLRIELTSTENVLGLTPKGLKELKKKGLEQKKQSALDKLLGG